MSLRCGGGVDRARATLTGQRRPCYRPATGRLHRRSCRGTARSRRGRRRDLLRVGRALRLRCFGWVFACCCAAVAASRPALRKGLDRRRSPGSGERSERGSGDARFCVRARRVEGCCVCYGIRCGTQHRSDRCARRQNPASDGAMVNGGWAGILPSRGPFHDDGESLPLRGQIRRHDASFARHCPRERSIVRGSHSNGESWPRPADPPEARPTAPVEALSERRSTRGRSDAPPHEASPAATQQPGRSRRGSAATREHPPRDDERRGPDTSRGRGCRVRAARGSSGQEVLRVRP